MGYHKEKLCNSEVPKGEERGERAEKKLFKEIIAMNFPNLRRDLDIHKAQKSPKKKINPRGLLQGTL